MYILYLDAKQKYLKKLIEEAKKPPHCPQCGSRVYTPINSRQHFSFFLHNLPGSKFGRIIISSLQCLECGCQWEQRILDRNISD